MELSLLWLVMAVGHSSGIALEAVVVVHSLPRGKSSKGLSLGGPPDKAVSHGSGRSSRHVCCCLHSLRVGAR